MHESEIDTPALVIDLDIMEANMDRMAAFCREAGVGLRAHAKTHKSPVIAHWQIDRGAVGQCVQKPAEAEVLAWGGVRDILISNEVVSERKLQRVAALQAMATVSVCADNAATVELIEAIAEAAGRRMTVLVEIDVMGARCGIEPGAEAAALAKRIAASRHLVFGGLQSYHGGAQHRRSEEERRSAIADAVRKTVVTIDAIRGQGLSCAIVGGAGTGTFRHEAASGVYTEIQAGSYIFMDADYARNDPTPEFQQSLFVLSTVMSAARDGRAVLDCGHKGVAIDSGLPLVHGRPDIDYIGASDEHGALTLRDTSLRVGEQLRLVPGHCDPTVDRYDWYVGLRGQRVACVFPVAARGMMQ
ncbi:DSD1 family PLP-dependent enzyme [Rhizobium sp. YIM 134829]|uniref:DSD1 family PLP-dependent enzyme n=1 Tax=Rhizobium sp. YIM 134829 TaxID=3390453 RepID=UPI003978935A